MAHHTTDTDNAQLSKQMAELNRRMDLMEQSNDRFRETTDRKFERMEQSNARFQQTMDIKFKDMEKSIASLQKSFALMAVPINKLTQATCRAQAEALDPSQQVDHYIRCLESMHEDDIKISAPYFW